MQSTQHPESTDDYLSRDEAVRLLGVKPATLYTYVSRGLLQSYPGAHKKERLYLRQDVERLRALGHIRSGERFTANEGLRWGEPIIQTSITQLTPAGPKYRNRLATDLVRSHGSFESVAELLWSGTLLDEHTSWRLTSSRLDANRVVNSLGGLKGQADLIQLFTLLTLTTGIAESERSEVQNGTTTLAARHIIAALVGSLGFLSKRRAYAFPEGTGSIAEAVAQSFSVTANEESIGALNATLVLSADHELAPATFAARVAAASGAGLHSCITSALCTHAGSRVRKACDKAEELFFDAPVNTELRRRLAALQKGGMKLPGFNHPLYPKGDPRALSLIATAKSLSRQTKQSERLYALLDLFTAEFDALPSVEVGLVAICLALGLPRQSAGALFTLGRAAGWIAHVLEQRLAGVMLRPTPRYVGLSQ